MRCRGDGAIVMRLRHVGMRDVYDGCERLDGAGVTASPHLPRQEGHLQQLFVHVGGPMKFPCRREVHAKRFNIVNFLNIDTTLTLF